MLNNMIGTKRISDCEIEITSQKTQPEPIKIIYNRAFIEEQIKRIITARDTYIASRNADIAECQTILNEMDKLGIINKTSPD